MSSGSKVIKMFPKSIDLTENPSTISPSISSVIGYSSIFCRKTHVDMMSKVQVNMYAAGLHRKGSDAVNRYTMLEIKDRFELMNAAFGQEDYRVDKNLNVTQSDFL